jgi:hypothetical protein
MSTVPAKLAGGAVAVHEVVEVQLRALAAVVPNSAVVDPTTKPVPVTATVVAPERGPADGLTELTVGAVRGWNT